MKLRECFDDPPSITREAVDELLEDSVEAEAPANKNHINFQELCYESFQIGEKNRHIP